ncbi:MULTISPECIES: SDR family oxidoreductase [Arthrospira]|uniref:Chaperon-like protein for quinone binding n=1 Tax=Limnospira platensis NIES-46 TaxID=1236695 RepID=A0A5M3TD32_LIMPL|nr:MULTISPECIES: SDR family oxidoreductase [Arthrospira]AMW30928.1 3-beta hydroxysteroid dehydrogenase [Arthrospira platensis YZ]KDR58854.1 3-beta hydroxysteroid dehydrogenase [Arthrospira platensis str. Paraca]MBD2667770.1 SDR family oxidoreductase [Arthrospira platensis FACHB-439]MBD2711130.1 SDR family oxidoreductase [Arthrospira platensis FACHB-835]MDF2208274.1 SDR family oxidoreductase [Arthrospira platensis NCB002]MDT9183924.1 SDR family oxidoreductase [Limnospira sp. PMC 289.06]MDT929
MTLLIVGATGTLGRQIARRALDEGYQVRCLARSYKKAAFLKEWGAELVPGDLCDPETLKPALEGVKVVIDAATARPTDSLSIKDVDWKGKVALIQAAKAAGVERFVFFSFLDAEKYTQVPLLEIKRCTEKFLAESGLKYTILRPCGFLQGLIGQFAIPILDGQSVWVPGVSSPIAYMDTQDIAKITIRALSVPEAENKTFPVVGSRAWTADEIIRLCERLSGKQARVTRTPNSIVRIVRKVTRFFQWSLNISDRLAFVEVLATGQPLKASMDETYQILGMNPEENTTLESYLQEYFGRIMKKLKELEYEREKQKKRKQKRSPFKS